MPEFDLKVEIDEVERGFRQLEQMPETAMRARRYASHQAAERVIAKIKEAYREAGINERVDERRIFNFFLEKTFGARAWAGLNPLPAGELIPRSERDYGRTPGGAVVFRGERIPHSFWLRANNGQVALIRTGKDPGDVERLLIPIHELVEIEAVNNTQLQQVYLKAYERELRRLLDLSEIE